MSNERLKIAAVIPCYRERKHILAVLEKFGDDVDYIFVIDDACPDETGAHVTERCTDPRVSVVRHDRNQGVGGATITGYRRALETDADIFVKVDGDGQMDPAQISKLVKPIVLGRADYAKGNRFYRLKGISDMPALRLFGNLALSFASKMSSGYWKIFDPTNGFTAIERRVAAFLDLDGIDKGFFFESDMLFQLNLSRAVVADVPLDGIYGDEESTLKISKIFFPFLVKHLSNLIRRIFYNYFLRDFSVASIELVTGLALILFSLIFGGDAWIESVTTGVPAATGVIILAALPFLVGTILLIAFVNYDVQNQPDAPVHKLL